MDDFTYFLRGLFADPQFIITLAICLGFILLLSVLETFTNLFNLKLGRKKIMFVYRAKITRTVGLSEREELETLLDCWSILQDCSVPGVERYIDIPQPFYDQFQQFALDNNLMISNIEGIMHVRPRLHSVKRDPDLELMSCP